MKKTQKTSVVMLISSLGIVGTIGIFRRYIPISSPLLAFFRGIIGAASLFIFVLLRKRTALQKVPGKLLVGLVINGAFLGINWILLFEAYTYTTISKATLCYYLQPTIVLLLSPLLFGEKLTAKKLLCAAAALVGMVMVSGIVSADGAPADDIRGVLFGLGAACFYSLVVILNKKITGIGIYEKTIIQLFSASATLLPYLIMNGEFNGITLDIQTLLPVLVVGIIHTGLVYALYFGSMDGLKAQTISVLSYIDPVVAMIVSALILREGMTLSGIIGAALIIGSMVVSEYIKP